MDNYSVKKNIETRRKKMKCTQKKVADEIGLSRQAYRALEKGKTVLVNDAIGDIAEVLHTTKEELLLGYNPDNRDGSLGEMRQNYESMLEVYRKEVDRLNEKVQDLRKIISAQDENLSSRQDTINMLRSRLDEASKKLAEYDGNM